MNGNNVLMNFNYGKNVEMGCECYGFWVSMQIFAFIRKQRCVMRCVFIARCRMTDKELICG